MSVGVIQRSAGIRGRLGSMRARLLAGSFLLVFCAWSVDTLGFEREPKKTLAAQVAPTAGAFVIADPPDRAALDRFLADAGSPPAALVIDVQRDPFAMPPNWSIAGAQPVQNAKPSLEALDAPVEGELTETPEKPFADVHQLQGVILGSRPLALIDGNGYRVGDWIDGYRIVSLARDRVELRGRGGRVVLRVVEPGLNPARNSP